MTHTVTLLRSMGADPEKLSKTPIKPSWESYTASVKSPRLSVCVIRRGPKNRTEVLKAFKPAKYVVIINEVQREIIIKEIEPKWIGRITDDLEVARIAGILEQYNVGREAGVSKSLIAIRRAVEALETSTGDFDNRGLFSTYYINERYRASIKSRYIDLSKEIADLELANMHDSLKILGYTIKGHGVHRINENLTLVLTGQKDMAALVTGSREVPTFTAVAQLEHTPWVILTNGTIWRLYSSRVSASSTNYFEASLEFGNQKKSLFVAAIFSPDLYEGKIPPIQELLERSNAQAKRLGDNLARDILAPDGVMINLAKAVIGYNRRREYTPEELDEAKAAALKVLYRCWFLLYAESRELLPVSDRKYTPASMRGLHDHLDTYESDPDGCGCWTHLKKLFGVIRNGSPQMNIPRYDGGLFEHNPDLDGQDISNRHLVRSMRGLLELDSEAIDYSGLGVRHLGSVYEELLDATIRQARQDILLKEEGDKIVEVKARANATYAYARGDLYLLGRGGTISRKQGGAFYTPDEFVKFLVRRGLGPILEDREKHVAEDIKKYNQAKTDANLKRCMDRLLDIQVLDPAMGSGHFLVEALNQITQWASQMLEKYREHPLWKELEADRTRVINAQKKDGVTIDTRLLTHDVLLKRKVMKRCIFGVDINPLAVELARLSLWLDSFAIGVPLTYIDHHIKHGDSTIGSWLSEIGDSIQTSLDEFEGLAKADRYMKKISANSDITIEQVMQSRQEYNKFTNEMSDIKWLLDGLSAIKMKPGIIPKKTKNVRKWLEGVYASNNDVKRQIDKLTKKHTFFNWELELIDAFTDGRKGFDLIIGNPPWKKNKPETLDFFSTYDPTFRKVGNAIDKNRRKAYLLKNPEIEASYEEYKELIDDKGRFYKTYNLQGAGDTDLWQIILEQAMLIISKNGLVSMLLPQQLLLNTGAKLIRKQILEKNIIQLYVFENSHMVDGKMKSIFPIHKEYRFILLTWQNKTGTEKQKFKTGFWLHDMSCLENHNIEKTKFSSMSSNDVIVISPNDYRIPETNANGITLLRKFSTFPDYAKILPSGWNMKMTQCFHVTADSNLFRKDGFGLPVMEGKTIYQFVHNMNKSRYYVEKDIGLKRLSKIKAFDNNQIKYLKQYKVGFSRITSPTTTRTVIGTLIPPNHFHTDKIYSYLLYKNNNIPDNPEANLMSCYILGVINSFVFDYLARQKTRLEIGNIILNTKVPFPDKHTINKIAKLTAQLCCGTNEMESLAESLGIPNNKLDLISRIKTNAQLDIIVAQAYNLNLEDYTTILKSFNLDETGIQSGDEDLVWNNKKFRKRYWGAVRTEALKTFGVGTR
ncbi:MAG: BREX-1 system adenine-specific DNA-methyltransferase PglX [Alphaproteobacteria bacterium]|nr:BREX-1 system adenine-specific DNA-methyltransferase PglX [Alphaproteobacteria bacterium]